MVSLAEFSYSRRSHFDRLRKPPHFREIDPESADLKMYQDLFIFTFLEENCKGGANILEIGGGDSRVIPALRNKFNFWNLDRLEGLGNGPKTLADRSGFHLVRDYIGDFSKALPDESFDCVFSISVFEHLQEDDELFGRVCNDIARLLKPGGISVHCIDALVKDDGIWTNRIVDFLYAHVPVINRRIAGADIKADSDLFVMSESAYKERWQATTGRSYREFGKPFSLNLIWEKTHESEMRNVRQSTRGSMTILEKTSLPRISVVTPSLNQGQFLEECIDSVLSQSYPNLEYIIMDGGSKDNSVEIIKKYQQHLSFWQSKPDAGQYHAINGGFDKSTGEIMAWLNSDDKYHPGSLWKVAHAFSEYPQLQWITGRPTAWDEDGSLALVESELEIWTRDRLLKGPVNESFLQQESTFWKRSLWKECGSRLDCSYELAADLELWLRFSRKAQLVSVDTLLAGYRYQMNQRGHVLRKEYHEEAERILEREMAYERDAVPSSVSANAGLVLIPATAFDSVAASGKHDVSFQASTVRALSVLSARQLVELREKEQELELLKDSLQERLRSIEAAAISLKEKEAEILRTQAVAEDRLRSVEAASISLKEKEAEIASTQKAAQERSRLLVEKEEMIRSMYQIAEERRLVIFQINEELEAIKRHWAYRIAAKVKGLLKGKPH